MASIDVNQDNFNTAVLSKSYEKPVLVDFYATWCGPCQVLKPMLEKLAGEYDFVLAKVDIDQNPELATQFNVQGVPDVRIANQGKLKSGFVGALPEAQLHQFLADLNLKSSLETQLEAARKATKLGNVQQSKQIYDSLFEQYPENHQVILEAAQFLVHINQLEIAERMLNTIHPSEREYYGKAESLKTLIQLKREANTAGESELDQKFSEAARLTLQEEYEAALSHFLEIVSKNRSYKDDGARKAMLAIFNLLGDTHPLTQKYRNELMLTLY